MHADSTLVLPYASVEAADGPKDPHPARVLVEARLLWGGVVLGVAHVRPNDAVRIADLALDVPGGGDTVIARVSAGGVALVLPNGTEVPAGCRMTLRLGRAKLRVALVADDAGAVPRSKSDGRVRRGVLAATVLHLAVLACVVHGRGSPAALEEGSRAALEKYMAAAEARAQSEIAATMPPAESLFSSQGASGPAARRDEGSAGNPSRTNDNARMRVTRGLDRHASLPGTEQQSLPGGRPSDAEVSTFGLIALLAGEAGQRAGSSQFASDTGRSAMGNIFGATIDDAAGVGGLGLSSAGSGAGERGAGVALQGIGTVGMGNGGAGAGEGLGLGNVGTIGHGAGTGTTGGFGSGTGRLVGTHITRAPTLCMCGAFQAKGRLPPETIQRIVRQSFGRFRGCYERGLERDPGLEGRVVVRFVIDRAGEVNTAVASTSESAMSDNAVSACVVRAFESITFPQPEGGIVTVTYPLTFNRE